MFTNKEYILVLPSWYPSDVNKFNGDFNKRFVEAVSLKVSQIVLYVVGKSNLKQTYSTISIDSNVKTYIVYYPLNKQFFSRVIGSFFYLYYHLKFIRIIFSENGLPKLTQVYVFWTTGFIALVLKILYKIPYVITENWTAFYTGSPPDLYKHNFFIKILFKIILNGSNHFIAVAEKLKCRILEWNSNSKITVVPNVVDTLIFNYQYKERVSDKFRFVHVSTMKVQKNIIGLLEGYEAALKKDSNLELILVGEIPNNVQIKINSFPILKNNIICTGEIDYSLVKDIMKHSDALIMFSRYENLPCVILEALCCGIPVITTDAGGCAEVINETNGIVVENENIDELTQSIEYMVKNIGSFNSKEISHKAINNFNYNTISSKILKVYESIV